MNLNQQIRDNSSSANASSHRSGKVQCLPGTGLSGDSESRASGVSGTSSSRVSGVGSGGGLFATLSEHNSISFFESSNAEGSVNQMGEPHKFVLSLKIAWTVQEEFTLTKGQ